MGRPATESLVDYARPTPGMQVLDVASGTGEPAISIASRITPSGYVTALDLSPELLEIAGRRAEARGLQNITLRQGDAHFLPFPANTFDLATSRFGVMFFREVERALAEVLRVLRPGARVCLLAWGPFEQPYWQSMMGVVHRHVGGALLDAGGPNPFCFGQPGSLSAVLNAVGFRDVHEETRTLSWTWPGPPEEVWEQAQAVAVPFRPMLERVPKEQWPEINAEVCAAVSKYYDGEKIDFGATVVLASGTK
jgi:SAM-dependent methyltransferase